MRNRNFIEVLIVSLLFVGCGGEGSNTLVSSVTDELVVNGTTSKTGTGYYVDAAVSGVKYQCGTQEGITDMVGKFIFEEGENCIFKLGDLVLRELNSTSLEENVTIFEDNVDVARLLQTADSDGNPSNGIHVLFETHEVMQEQKIKVIPKDDATLLNIKEGIKEKNPEAYNGALVSGTEAEAHLNETRKRLASDGRRTQNNIEEENETLRTVIIQNQLNDRELTEPFVIPNTINDKNSTEDLREVLIQEQENEVTENLEDLRELLSPREENSTISRERPKILSSVTSENGIQRLSMFRNNNSLMGQENVASNEVLISFKEGMADSSEFKEKLAQYLGTEHKLESFSTISVGHIKSNLKNSDDLKIILQKPEFSPYIEFVTENYIMNLAVTNDTSYADLWAVENNGQIVNSVVGTVDADMDVLEAWEKTTGSKEVIVVVLDTGVDYTHSDLADNMWQGNVNHGYDFAADNEGGNDVDPMPDLPYADNGHFHGTHIAGIIGAVANNNNGIAGVAQNVSIMALKVFRPDGTGYTSDILEALDYVSQKIDEGENIVAINASFAGGGSQSDTLNTVIKDLGAKGVVFCAAAGNENTDNDVLAVFPASYDASNVISIAASDENDNLASFSNYGATSVDVTAPGTNILSTYPDNSYAYFEGSSMATPNVAGTVALLASYYPDASADELKAMIINNVDVKSTLNTKVLTSGRVNTNEALGDKDVPIANIAPIAVNDSYITEYMTAKNLDILTNDSDVDGDSLSIITFTQGVNGSVTQDGIELIFSPNDDFSGEDTFTYTISDGEANVTATVTMTVNDEDQVNSVPIANDDLIETAYETLVKFKVLLNDSDEQNDTLSIISFAQTLNGTLILDTEEFTYVPNNSFSGEDGFEYTISDGLASTTAKVQIFVAEETSENNDTNSADNNEIQSEHRQMGHNRTRLRNLGSMFMP